jgi:hypothetical protein
MDFIEVWYLIVYIVGQCPVEINIIASKIWAIQMGPKKQKCFF